MPCVQCCETYANWIHAAADNMNHLTCDPESVEIIFAKLFCYAIPVNLSSH